MLDRKSKLKERIEKILKIHKEMETTIYSIERKMNQMKQKINVWNDVIATNEKNLFIEDLAEFDATLICLHIEHTPTEQLLCQIKHRNERNSDD